MDKILSCLDIIACLEHSLSHCITEWVNIRIPIWEKYGLFMLWKRYYLI